MTVEIYCRPQSDSAVKLVAGVWTADTKCQTAHLDLTIRIQIRSLAGHQTHPSYLRSTPKLWRLLQSFILMEGSSLSKYARLGIYPGFVCVCVFFFFIKHAWQPAFKVSTMCVRYMHDSWNPDSLHPPEDTLPHWCQCWQSSYSNLKAYKGFQNQQRKPSFFFCEMESNVDNCNH